MRRAVGPVLARRIHPVAERGTEGGVGGNGSGGSRKPIAVDLKRTEGDDPGNPNPGVAGNSPQQAPGDMVSGSRVGQQGTLAERGTRPRAPRDTRYIWSYIFGAVCPERAEAAALIMPHADTQAMSAHLAEIAKTVASGAHALLILDGAGWHGSQSWRYPTTSPCSNSRPIPLNSTRWKMCGLICVPTSSPYPSSTIMSRSSTGVAKHGTSLQTTKPQSRQSD